VQITRESEEATQPAWSPDGTKLAYLVGPRQQGKIKICDADGGNAHLLFDGEGPQRSPAWSPDGKQIVYRAYHPANPTELKAYTELLAQRLVRIICEQCKRPTQLSPQLLQESGLDPKVYGSYTFYEGAGCLDCAGTGYRGRTAIHELLDLSDRIREMILERKPASESVGA
jgi:Tol biopolymer transport system component